MPFPDLQTLLQASNSSRQFLLSLPVDVQLQLHEQNGWIHTQADLRRYAAYYEELLSIDEEDEYEFIG